MAATPEVGMTGTEETKFTVGANPFGGDEVSVTDQLELAEKKDVEEVEVDSDGNDAKNSDSDPAIVQSGIESGDKENRKNTDHGADSIADDLVQTSSETTHEPNVKVIFHTKKPESDKGAETDQVITSDPIDHELLEYNRHLSLNNSLKSHSGEFGGTNWTKEFYLGQESKTWPEKIFPVVPNPSLEDVECDSSKLPYKLGQSALEFMADRPTWKKVHHPKYTGAIREAVNEILSVAESKVETLINREEQKIWDVGFGFKGSDEVKSSEFEDESKIEADLGEVWMDAVASMGDVDADGEIEEPENPSDSSLTSTSEFKKTESQLTFSSPTQDESQTEMKDDQDQDPVQTETSNSGNSEENQNQEKESSSQNDNISSGYQPGSNIENDFQFMKEVEGFGKDLCKDLKEVSQENGQITAQAPIPKWLDTAEMRHRGYTGYPPPRKSELYGGYGNDESRKEQMKSATLETPPSRGELKLTTRAGYQFKWKTIPREEKKLVDVEPTSWKDQGKSATLEPPPTPSRSELKLTTKAGYHFQWKPIPREQAIKLETDEKEKVKKEVEKKDGRLNRWKSRVLGWMKRKE